MRWWDSSASSSARLRSIDRNRSPQQGSPRSSAGCQLEGFADYLKSSEVLTPISVRVPPRRLRRFVERHKIVHRNLSRSDSIQDFVDFSFRSSEVGLTHRHLGATDRICNRLLQFFRATGRFLYRGVLPKLDAVLCLRAVARLCVRWEVWALLTAFAGSASLPP